jgi:REP element-mobilizing transposase RayT
VVCGLILDLRQNFGIGGYVARKLRIQFQGAIYHVINRGNYRSDLFVSPGEAQAFLETVKEAKQLMGWRMHAYVLMRNHYHLALETPEPNLVEGMHWLQSTWATRFNRFRQERGHLFQGRYQALLIQDTAALGRVVDYIHLNPVRAKIVPAEQVANYRWSSLDGIVKGANWIDDRGWCAGVRFGSDEAGRRAYGDYLVEVGQDEARWDALGIKGLSKGWAIGSADWRKEMGKEYGQRALNPGFEHSEVQELREGAWEASVMEALAALGRKDTDLATKPRRQEWKLMVAVRARGRSGASLAWLAARLQIGGAATLRSYLYRLRMENHLQNTA